MLARAVLIALLFASTALAQFQAQDGWGLPRRVAATSITQGLALDLPGQRLVLADQSGLVTQDLKGGDPKPLLAVQGIRNLRGTGGGPGLGLAWYVRNLTDNSAIWAWFGGAARKLAESEYADLAITSLGGKPLVVYATSEGEDTVIYAHPWDGPRVAVRRTRLNVGALAVGVTAGGRIGVLFAEGYRNAQDEKYNAILSTGTLKTGFESRRLAAAVYTGREQRYALAVRGENLLPVWWYESDDEQRLAALTKRHNPRLAVLDAGQIREFAPPGNVLGQIGTRLYYSLSTDIWALELQGGTTTRQLIAPLGLTGATLSETAGVRAIAWQSLGNDGFASTVFLSDSSRAYEPTPLDRLSVVMGWNPWYPGQSALAQTLLSLLIAAGAVMLTAPLVWFGSHQWRLGVVAATLFGAGFVLLSRVLSGSFQAPGWSLEALLTPPWWSVGLGVALGLLAVGLARRKLNATELGPTIASSLVVLLGVFVMMFSKAGFIHF